MNISNTLSFVEHENENETEKMQMIYERANATVERRTAKILYIVGGSYIVTMTLNFAITLTTYLMKGLDKDDYLDFYYIIW